MELKESERIILQAMKDVHDKVGFYPTQSQLVGYVVKNGLLKGFSTNYSKYLDPLIRHARFIKIFAGTRSEQLELTAKGQKALTN